MTISTLSVFASSLALALCITGCASKRKIDDPPLTAACKKGGALFETDGTIKRVKASCGEDVQECRDTGETRPVCLPSSRDPTVNPSITQINPDTQLLVFKRTDNMPHPYDVLSPSSCCIWSYVLIGGVWTPFCIVPPQANGTCP
jgi:hypothetical protein